MRWTGTVRSDATVKGAKVSIFAQNAYGGSAFAGARLAIGPGALSGSPQWAIDAWTPGKTTRKVCTLPRPVGAEKIGVSLHMLPTQYKLNGVNNRYRAESLPLGAARQEDSNG